MPLFTDGALLVRARSVDQLAERLGIDRAALGFLEDSPIAILRDELGDRATRALVVILRRIAPADADFLGASLRPWRQLPSGESVVVFNGEERQSFQVADFEDGASRILADYTGGRWVRR